MNKNLAVFAFIALTLASLTSLAVPQVSAAWLIDRSGTLIKVDGIVLGDETEEEKDSDTNIENMAPDTEVIDEDSTKNLQEMQLRQQKMLDEKAKQKLKTELEAKKKIQEKSRETLKKQTELRLKSKERAATTSEFDVRSEDGKLKLKQEIRNEKGDLIKKIESEIEGEELNVEQEDGNNVVINEIGSGKLELIKDKIKTHSDLKMNIGDKNEISVTLPNGKVREIALPDQALEKLVANGVITQTEGSGGAYVLTTGTNDIPVYSGVEGEVEKKLFGFKLHFKHKLDVAAGTSEDGTVQIGDVVGSSSQETSPWRRILEKFSKTI